MKAIAYAIYNKENPLIKFYLRGLFYNLRMNKLIYPDWTNAISYSEEIYQEYKAYFDWLFANFNCIQYHHEKKPAHCEGMLWRFDGVKDFEYLLCRDTDAITTLREADSVKRWLIKSEIVHAMQDNIVHSIALMGGMVGFKTEPFLGLVGNKLLCVGEDLTRHGADQDFLMREIYPLIKHSIYLDRFPDMMTNEPLWESNLVCRHIGSAGIVEMELLRFFQRFESKEENDKHESIKHICPHVFSLV